MVAVETINQSPGVCGAYEKVLFGFSYLASANIINILRAIASASQILYIEIYIHTKKS